MVLTRRSAASGDENAPATKTLKVCVRAHCYCASLVRTRQITSFSDLFDYTKSVLNLYVESLNYFSYTILGLLVLLLSEGYAMLMRPKKAETAVHGCHCLGDMAVRRR